MLTRKELVFPVCNYCLQPAQFRCIMIQSHVVSFSDLLNPHDRFIKERKKEHRRISIISCVIVWGWPFVRLALRAAIASSPYSTLSSQLCWVVVLRAGAPSGPLISFCLGLHATPNYDYQLPTSLSLTHLAHVPVATWIYIICAPTRIQTTHL